MFDTLTRCSEDIYDMKWGRRGCDIGEVPREDMWKKLKDSNAEKARQREAEKKKQTQG